MKKTLLSLFFATGLFGLLVSCFCKDVNPYWNITDFTIEVLDANRAPLVNNQYQGDALILNIDMDTYFHANTYNPFVNSCYATQPCPRDGHRGMKDPVVAITITSSEVYNGIPAGQSLNQFARAQGEFTLDELINSRQFFTFEYYEQHLEIRLTQKPTDNAVHTFTVKMETDAGHSKEAQTTAITWQ